MASDLETFTYSPNVPRELIIDMHELQFLSVYQRNNPLNLGCWENTRKFFNHEPRRVLYKLYECFPTIPK